MKKRYQLEMAIKIDDVISKATIGKKTENKVIGI
jgi:hypothetical protein